MIRLRAQARRAGDEPHLRRAARAGDRHHHRRRRRRDPARRADGRHEQERDAALHRADQRSDGGQDAADGRARHGRGVRPGRQDRGAGLRRGDRLRHAGGGARQPARAGGLSRLGACADARRSEDTDDARTSTTCTPTTARATSCTASTFDVGEGEIVSLLGRNGSGRSTTAKAIMGMVRRRPARCDWQGPARSSASKPYEIAHLGIGYVPENRDIFPKLTVHQNLRSARRARKQQSARWCFDDMYRMFPRLKERQHTEAGVLSGGEQQMLTLCRTLMGDPDLIMIDEPTEGLAPKIVELVARVPEDAQGARHLGAADRAEADHRAGRSPTALLVMGHGTHRVRRHAGQPARGRR